MRKKKTSEKIELIEKIGFVLGLIFLSALYGIYAERKNIFPSNMIRHAERAFDQIKAEIDPWYVKKSSHEISVSRKADRFDDNRLNKFVHIDTEDNLAVSIKNNNGDLVHKWVISWFDLWEDASHLPVSSRPKTKPGTLIHGAHVFDNGDLVFNFEFLGMVKLDICGNVLWRLPMRTHHSIFIDDQGDIWTSMRSIRKKSAPQRLFKQVHEPWIAKISPDGKLIFKKSIFALLEKNNLHGIIYASAHHNFVPTISGDTMHLNDVEVFSTSMPAGFFTPGDVMVSLRNPNTVVVFDQDDWSVKFLVTHATVRQHDPDFLDGNHISIYDNNNRFAPGSKKAFSRIIKVSAPDNKIDVIFQGSPEEPFYSATLGKHQWLDDGHLLITESVEGRAFEIDQQGNIVWEYNNLIEANKVGSLQEAERLPKELDEAFFKERAGKCKIAE